MRKLITFCALVFCVTGGYAVDESPNRIYLYEDPRLNTELDNVYYRANINLHNSQYGYSALLGPITMSSSCYIAGTLYVGGTVTIGTATITSLDITEDMLVGRDLFVTRYSTFSNFVNFDTDVRMTDGHNFNTGDSSKINLGANSNIEFTDNSGIIQWNSTSDSMQISGNQPDTISILDADSSNLLAIDSGKTDGTRGVYSYADLYMQGYSILDIASCYVNNVLDIKFGGTIELGANTAINFSDTDTAGIFFTPGDGIKFRHDTVTDTLLVSSDSVQTYVDLLVDNADITVTGDGAATGNITAERILTGSIYPDEIVMAVDQKLYMGQSLHYITFDGAPTPEWEFYIDNAKEFSLSAASATIYGGLTTTGTIATDKSLYVGDNLYITDYSYFTNSGTFYTDLAVNDDMDVYGDFNARGTLGVTGVSTFNDDIWLVGNYLFFNGNDAGTLKDSIQGGYGDIRLNCLDKNVWRVQVDTTSIYHDVNISSNVYIAGNLVVVGTTTLTATAVDHGGLAGLDGDDHPQYLLADGSRDLTADWSIATYEIISSSKITAALLVGNGAGITNISASALPAEITVSTVNATAGRSNIYVSSSVVIPALATLYLDGGGDTYIKESTTNQLDFTAGNTTILSLTALGAALPATGRLYLDGVGGDSFIYESSLNRVDFLVGGATPFKLATASATVNGSLYATAFYGDGSNLTGIAAGALPPDVTFDDLVVTGTVKLPDLGEDWSITSYEIISTSDITAAYFHGDGSNLTGIAAGALPPDVTFDDLTVTGTIKLSATKPLYFDGGSDTYISESADNVLSFYANGGECAKVTTAGLVLPSEKEIYFTDVNTARLLYTGTPGSTGRLRIGDNGSLAMEIKEGAVVIPAASRLYFDGTAGTPGSDTYIHEKSANNLAFVAGGVEKLVVSDTAVSAPEITISTINATSGQWAIAMTSSVWVKTGTTGEIQINPTGGVEVVNYTSGGYIDFSSTTRLNAAISYDGRIQYQQNTDTINFYHRAAAGPIGGWKSDGLFVDATDKFYLDGGGDTYITEASGNTIDMYAGGVKQFSQTATGVTIATMTVSNTATIAQHMKRIYYTTLTSSATSVDITVNQKNYYRVIADFVNPLNSQTVYCIRYNNRADVSDYYQVNDYYYASAKVESITNNTRFAVGFSTSSSVEFSHVQAIVDIIPGRAAVSGESSSNRGYPSFFASWVVTAYASANVYGGGSFYGMCTDNDARDEVLTTLTILANVTNGLGIGTYIEVWEEQ